MISSLDLIDGRGAGFPRPRRPDFFGPFFPPQNISILHTHTHTHTYTHTHTHTQSPKPSPGRFDPGYFHSMPSNIEPPAHKRVAARTQGEQLDYDARMGRQSIVKRSSAVSATRTASPAPRAESGASLTSNTSDTRNLIERHGGWQNCISHGV